MCIRDSRHTHRHFSKNDFFSCFVCSTIRICNNLEHDFFCHLVVSLRNMEVKNVVTYGIDGARMFMMCTYSHKVASGNGKSNSDGCSIAEVLPAWVAHRLNDENKHECDDGFNEETLARGQFFIHCCQTEVSLPLIWYNKLHEFIKCN